MNRTPSRVIDFQTTLKKLHELVSAPTYPNFEPRVFGCTTYVHQNTGKLEPRVVKYMFICYANLEKGYKFYDPEKQKMYITKDVVFHENIPFICHECSLQRGENSKHL